MRPRVLLDIDGVVCDFLTPFIAHINSAMGTSHKLEDMTQWDMYSSFNVPQDVREIVDSIIKTPGYCDSLKPLPGAVDGAKKLMEIADVYVVTSPWNSDTWESERRQWIRRYLGLGGDHVINTRAKHVVAGDALIDDKDETLKRWAKCHPHGLALRWLGPANHLAHYNGHSTCDWDRAIEIILSHADLLGDTRPWKHT
jgi:5'(3')-deoxyribonucleotidase